MFWLSGRLWQMHPDCFHCNTKISCFTAMIQCTQTTRTTRMCSLCKITWHKNLPKLIHSDKKETGIKQTQNNPRSHQSVSDFWVYNHFCHVHATSHLVCWALIQTNPHKWRFSSVFKRSIFCSRRLHLFDQKYIKNSNIVKYSYYSK